MQVVDILIYKGREELEVSSLGNNPSNHFNDILHSNNGILMIADGSPSTQAAASSGRLINLDSSNLTGETYLQRNHMSAYYCLFMQVNDYISVPAERKLDAARAAAISPFMDRFYRNMDAYGRG